MKLTENTRLAFISIVVLIAKICLIPLTHVVDCDAVSRIFLTQQWYEDPHWITTGVWLPFHFYLNGFAFWIYYDRELSPVLFNLVLSCLSIFPYYHFVKKEFNANGALYSTLLFIISPVLFRNGFMALSETPFWFFMVYTLYFISKGFFSGKTTWFFLAGIAMGIASGLRFEGWLLIVLFSLLVFLRKNLKGAIAFALVSSVFPIIWIYCSLSANGTFFHPDAPVFTVAAPGNTPFDWEGFARKGWFYPLSWVLSVGPVTAFFILKYISNRRMPLSLAYWAILPLVLMVVFLYKSYTGSIMLQHRFTGILAILTIPFFSFFITEKLKSQKLILLLIGISTVGLSFVYNTTGIAMIPRLKDKHALSVSKAINKNITTGSALLIDFDGWENTWFYALRSGLKPKDILINYSNNDLAGFLSGSEQKIKEYPNSVIVLKKGSEAEKYFREKILQENSSFQIVFENEKTFVCSRKNL